MLLIPEKYPTVPFEDATPLLDDPEQLVRTAEEQGYLYFKGLIPTELVDPVRALACEVAEGFGWVVADPKNPPFIYADPDAYFEGRGWDDPRFVELQVKVCYSDVFRKLVVHDNIMNVLATVYGEPAALALTNHCWLKLPGSPEHTTLPHQDIFYLPDCPRMWTVWYPLVDTPLDVGSLGVVPESHKREWPHIDNLTGIKVPRDVTFATGDTKPGDLVAFSAGTIHCAWSNVSPSYCRLSLDVRYEPAATSQSLLRPGS
jgi:hypothetical protein